MSGYVWYSFGSDTSGMALAKDLGMDSGKKPPDLNRYQVVVGWGCKLGESYDAQGMKEAVSKRSFRVLNHPEAIRSNRDKLKSLEAMDESGISVPGYVVREGREDATAFIRAIQMGVQQGRIAFPLIGHNREHKGSPFFCFTSEDIKYALDTGRKIDYFRSFCPGTEYRIHVFRDSVIWAQKKVLAKDPVESCARGLVAKLDRAQNKLVKQKKARVSLPDAKVTSWILGQVAEEMLIGPNQLLRSTNRGWEFEDMPLRDVPAEVTNQAINAIDAVGLDMGAVSASCDGRRARITSVLSAPSLSEEQRQTYVSSIREFAESRNVSDKRIPEVQEQAQPELLASLVREVGNASSEKLREALKILQGG